MPNPNFASEELTLIQADILYCETRRVRPPGFTAGFSMRGKNRRRALRESRTSDDRSYPISLMHVGSGTKGREKAHKKR